MAGSAQFIVTHNTRHFLGVDSLNIEAVTSGSLSEYFGEEMSTMNVNIPESLRRRAVALAQADGVSLEPRVAAEKSSSECSLKFPTLSQTSTIGLGQKTGT